MTEQQPRLLDSQFAGFLAARSLLSGTERDTFTHLICRLSMGLAGGDSCLPVSKGEEAIIQSSGLSGGSDKPLRLWHGKLYLQRFFAYEHALAGAIRSLAVESEALAGDEALLERLFGQKDTRETDWQRLAAERALEQSLLIISGGPGTGKTTTVVKILALLISASRQNLRIGLAAPTGKAAMRLQESIASSVLHLPLSDFILKNIPNQAATLHRLLGGMRFSPYFRHSASAPLPYDVVVVDEASMVDLALMSKLVDALRPGSRLILLGDKNQLASVESGTVLADMVSALPENRVELQKSYRFDTGIKGFAEAINRGDAASAWQQMEGDTPGNVTLLQEDVAGYGGRRYYKYMEAVYRAETLDDYKELFTRLHSFKILCAVRKGASGISGINRDVEDFLTEKGYDCVSSIYYCGRPVMITRNDYSLNLYNGDIGICLPDPAKSGTMKIWFERTDGRLQGLSPGRVGSCETVYALTIHKSQGAEIDEILVVLPEQESDLVSRELLYTAVTRARQTVTVKSNRAVFDRAVTEKIERHSGLAEQLVEGQ